jgi:PAS domain S-box-containing protein
MTRLLAVDDKEENLYLLQVLLTGSGYEVETARHGAEALVKARQNPPSLIISDLLMPVMDGFTLLQYWKRDERLRSIPFVVYTATYTEPKDERLALDLGADAFILKPAEPDEFIAQIKNILIRAESLCPPVPREPVDDQELLLQEYAQVLVRKLEDKLLDAEEATRRAQLSEERLLMALDAGNMGMWDWDLITGEIVWSAGHARLFGMEPEAFDGRLETFRTFIHPDDLEELEAKVADSRTLGALYQHEYRIVWSDGSEHWMWGNGRVINDPDGRPLRMCGVVMDITERKRIEARLLENVAFLQNLMDAMPHPVFYKDVEGRYLGCNRAFEQFYGLRREEIIGKNVHEIASKELADRYASADLELFRNPGAQTYQAVIESALGARHDVVFHKATFLGPDGRATGLIGSILDITDLKRAEEESRRAETQLRQAQKMEALGTLAGGIAHDFNNILGIIIGYTEIARWSLEKDPQVTEPLSQVLQAANRAKDLVQQILAFSRRSETEMKPVQVRLVFKEAMKMLRATLPSTIDIRENISSHRMVLGDPTQMHQVLMNLCTNAGHAMQEQGGLLEVTLTDEVLEAESDTGYSGRHPGHYVKLRVKDTGHGIDPIVLDRIFDPFFTTKEQGVGTGLGLAVVHGIVKGCGGSIEIESELGNGTTFTVLFPAVEAGSSSESAGLVFPRGHERVLVVDDEAGLANAMRQMLLTLGYEAVCHTSSLDALEAFIHQPGSRSFDLVITDMTMPGMTGLGFATELLRLKPNLPIIICTGFSEQTSSETAKRIGIKEFLMKPVTLSNLAMVARKVLDEAKTPCARSTDNEV